MIRFNVYVSQPEVKPGCVLRRSNVNVLEQRKLVNPSEVRPATSAAVSVRVASSAGSAPGGSIVTVLTYWIVYSRPMSSIKGTQSSKHVHFFCTHLRVS